MKLNIKFTLEKEILTIQKFKKITPHLESKSWLLFFNK